MNKPRSRKMRFAGIVAIAGVLAVATYAFTASNTVPATRAGDGTGTISGYTVTNVEYNLTTLDPSTVSSYEFDLDGTATTVRAKIVSGAATYDTCTAVVNHWTCTPATPVAVSSADSLRVIAVQ